MPKQSNLIQHRIIDFSTLLPNVADDFRKIIFMYWLRTHSQSVEKERKVLMKIFLRCQWQKTLRGKNVAFYFAPKSSNS